MCKKSARIIIRLICCIQHNSDFLSPFEVVSCVYGWGGVYRSWLCGSVDTLSRWPPSPVHGLCSSPSQVVQLFWCRREGWDGDVPCPVGLCRDTLGPLWCVNRGGTLYIYLRFTPVYRYTSYCKRGLCIPTSYTLLTSRYIAGKLATSEVALYPSPIHTWCTCFPLGAWIQHNFKRNKQLSGYMNRTYFKK